MTSKTGLTEPVKQNCKESIWGRTYVSLTFRLERKWRVPQRWAEWGVSPCLNMLLLHAFLHQPPESQRASFLTFNNSYLLTEDSIYLLVFPDHFKVWQQCFNTKWAATKLSSWPVEKQADVCKSVRDTTRKLKCLEHFVLLLSVKVIKSLYTQQQKLTTDIHFLWKVWSWQPPPSSLLGKVKSSFNLSGSVLTNCSHLIWLGWPVCRVNRCCLGGLAWWGCALAPHDAEMDVSSIGSYRNQWGWGWWCNLCTCRQRQTCTHKLIYPFCL